MGTIQNGIRFKGMYIDNHRCIGAVTNSKVFWRALYIFAGVSISIPTTGQEVINSLVGFPTHNDDREFNVNMDGEGTTIIIAIPQQLNLIRVTSSEGETLFNSNSITGNNFVLSDTINQIPDGNGNLLPYKIYMATSALPYSSGITLNIKTTR